jgi:hypothetical protein
MSEQKTFTVCSNATPVFTNCELSHNLNDQKEFSTEEELRKIFWKHVKDEPNFYIFFNKINDVVGCLNILVEVYYEDTTIVSSTSKKMTNKVQEVAMSLQEAGYIFNEAILENIVVSVDKLKCINLEDSFEKIRFAFKIGKRR